MKTVYVYVQNTLADWEAGYAMAELHSGRFFKSSVEPLTVKTCALSREPIETMGGVRILPEVTVDEICLSEAAMLILPGGDTWLKLQNEMILEKAAAFLSAGTAPLEFARRIFERLDVFASATLEAWYLLHKEKRPEYFAQLRESLPKQR